MKRGARCSRTSWLCSAITCPAGRDLSSGTLISTSGRYTSSSSLASDSESMVAPLFVDDGPLTVDHGDGPSSTVHGPNKKSPSQTWDGLALASVVPPNLGCLTKNSVVMQRSQPHFESTTITGVYPCPVTGAVRLCYSGGLPVSLCGSEDHSPLRSRAGFSARPACSLERCSMTTIPRHSLVRFADYMQKDLAVNGKINFRPELLCEALLGYVKHLSVHPPWLMVIIT
jgi:hypothetical protein